MSARLKQKNAVRKAAPAAPTLADLNMAEAVRLHHAGEFAKAEPLYRATIALNPQHAEAHYNVGLIYHSQNKLTEAVDAFREAVFAKRDYAEAYANLGTVLKAQGLKENALIFYRQALMLQPLSAHFHSNMGVLLQDMEIPVEAEQAFRKALICDPTYIWSYLNMAPSLLDLGKIDQSMTACERGTLLDPVSPMAHYNFAASLKSLNRLDQSIDSFRRAVAFNADFAEAHFALGQMLLTRGDFAEGWEEYEWRWKLSEYAWLKNIHGEFSAPRWMGEPATDKTILVYAEQGMGDAIQYVRYLPDVVARAGHVILAVHPPLKPLFSQIEGITLISLDQVPLPPFDFHTPLLSLPRVFKTDAKTIPVNVPYLKADPEKADFWKRRIGPGKERPRVGVVWAGNPTQKGDRWRSPGLKAMMPILSMPGIDFVALQMGPGRKDLETTPLPAGVLDLGKEIADFADTAAIMAGLDLVVTSCTAPLHLAGAMGVRTWGIIPFSPHLLWQLERTDSPWYPSLTLYRQDSPGTDWSGVAERVKTDLRSLARS